MNWNKNGQCFVPTIRTMVFAFSIVLSLFSSLHARQSSGAPFLKIPIGAEPAALGQAYTSLAHGINALNWNPAGIVHTPSYLNRPTLGFSLSHQDQFSEANLDHVGFILPSKTGKGMALGLDLVRLSYLDQDGRDAEGNKTGSFDAADMALGMALARNFGSFQAGGQLKLIRQELANQEANGFAVDLGFLSTTPLPRLYMGLAARNMGPSMKFIHEKYHLPMILSFGTAYRLNNPMTLAMDVSYKPYQRQTVLSFGSQILAGRNVALRAGYLAKLAEAVNSQSSEADRGSFGGINGLTGGIGLRLKQFSLDYSFTPFGELGAAQILTLSTWFGSNSKTQPTPTPSSKEKGRTILILPDSEESWWNDLRP